MPHLFFKQKIEQDLKKFNEHRVYPNEIIGPVPISNEERKTLNEAYQKIVIDGLDEIEKENFTDEQLFFLDKRSSKYYYYYGLNALDEEMLKCNKHNAVFASQFCPRCTKEIQNARK